MSLRFDEKTGEWVGVTGGVDLEELSQRQPKTKEAKQKKSQKNIQDQINSSEIYSFLMRLTQHLQNESGVKLNNTIFRNRQVAYYTGRTNQIVYSYHDSTWIAENGFREYPTVANVWRRRGYKAERINKTPRFQTNDKKHNVYMIALHEFAHAMQNEEGWGYKEGFSPRRDIHGQQFQEFLGMLIDSFPYETVKNI